MLIISGQSISDHPVAERRPERAGSAGRAQRGGPGRLWAGGGRGGQSGVGPVLEGACRTGHRRRSAGGGSVCCVFMSARLFAEGPGPSRIAVCR